MSLRNKTKSGRNIIAPLKLVNQNFLGGDIDRYDGGYDSGRFYDTEKKYLDEEESDSDLDIINDTIIYESDVSDQECDYETDYTSEEDDTDYYSEYSDEEASDDE